MNLPEIVSEDEWQRAHEELLAKDTFSDEFRIALRS